MNMESRMEMAQADLSPWLHGRSLADAWDQYQDEGYVIFPDVLTAGQLEQQRAALRPWLAVDQRGRNNFEGAQSNRIYGMLEKDPVFADLIAHPLQLAFADADHFAVHAPVPASQSICCLAKRPSPGISTTAIAAWRARAIRSACRPSGRSATPPRTMAPPKSSPAATNGVTSNQRAPIAAPISRPVSRTNRTAATMTIPT